MKYSFIIPVYNRPDEVDELLQSMTRQTLSAFEVIVVEDGSVRDCREVCARYAGKLDLHYYAKPQLLFTVQPGSFYPPPKVTSAVIRLELRDKPAVDTPDEAGLFRLIRGAFGQRRKAAANSIAAALGMPKAKVTAALEQAGLSPLVRPEQLTLEDFAALQQALLQNP